MSARSAGLLLHRPSDAGPQVLLGHPGGPYWAGKHAGAWSIPKGEYSPDEDPLAAARREFAEELGRPAPDGPAQHLGEVTQRGGKTVSAWAIAADFDVAVIHSNVVQLQWPRSGRIQTFPELDRAAWFDPDAAREAINPAQRIFLDRLRELVG